MRTQYRRTDATTEYFLYLNQHWMVYHAATGRYFVTDPSSNHVDVIDAATKEEIATIPVPGAFGIDDTSDHNTLWVGTLIGDVYTVGRTMCSQGFRALKVKSELPRNRSWRHVMRAAERSSACDGVFV